MGSKTPPFDIHTSRNVGNGDVDSNSFTLTKSTSPSQRRAYLDELFHKDFSEPVHPTEKYVEYCRMFQILGRELQEENLELQAQLDTTSAPVNSTSSRRTTDDSDFCKKRAPVVPPEKTAVVYSSPENDLRKVKGRDMPNSTYIPVTLPPYHWGQDSLHIYYSIPRDRKHADGQPWIVASNKKLQSTPKRDLKFLRTINLGKLGFRILVRRMFGQLKTIYVLAPETRPVNTSSSNTGP